MATQEECRAALVGLAAKLGGPDGTGKGPSLDRTLSCQVTDLDLTFSGRLREGRVEDITTDAAPKARIRFVVSSDDLVDLSSGKLAFGPAWSSGRLKVEASMLDLLKLRSLL